MPSPSIDVTSTIDIDLTKPLHLQIDKIEQKVREYKSQNKIVALKACTTDQPTPVTDIMITDDMIKALMRKLDIDLYSERFSVKHTDISILVPKFFLKEINQTKSNYFLSHLIPVGAITAGVVGSLTFIASSVFLVGTMTLLTGGIAAGIILGLAAIAGVVGLVKKYQDQKRIDQQQAAIAEAMPQVEAAINLAHANSSIAKENNTPSPTRSAEKSPVVTQTSSKTPLSLLWTDPTPSSTPASTPMLHKSMNQDVTDEDMANSYFATKRK